MRSHTIPYTTPKPPLKMNFKYEDIYAWILGIMSGGFAYINGLLWFNWGKVADLIWAMFVAIMTGIAGMVGKWAYDKYVKIWLDKLAIRKKKPGPPPIE